MSDSITAYAHGLENRAEVESLEALHQERRQLLITLAPLKAVHGPFGLFDHRRKSMVEAMKVKARLKFTQEGTKATEGMVDAAGHEDPQYNAFLDQMYAEKIAYLTQQTTLDEIEERIKNREVSLRAYTAECQLAH